MSLQQALHTTLFAPLGRTLTDPGVGGGAALVDPVDYFGSRLEWLYSAVNEAGLGATSAGPSTVTVGGPLGYIADESVHGRHLTQANTAKRIKLGEDGAGNRVFYFDGNKDISLDTASIDLSAQTKLSIFFAGRVASTSGVYKVPYYLNPAGAGVAQLINGTYVGALLHNGIQSHGTATAGVTTSPAIYEQICEPAHRRPMHATRVVIDGKRWEVQRNSLTDPATPGGAFSPGPLRFGDWGAAPFAFEGDINVFMAVSGDISDADREVILAYIASKSAVTYPQIYDPLNFNYANDYLSIDSHYGFSAYCYSALDYDTAATSVVVDYYNQGVIGGYVSLGVYVNGVYHSEIAPPGAGANAATVSLPPGSKRVSIFNSAASGNGAGVYAVQSNIRNITFNAPATSVAAPTDLLVYGDSVATGGHGSPLVQHAWPLLLRYQYGRDVAVYAESGRSFKTDYDHVSYGSGFRDPFVETVRGYSPAALWMAMGVNDYGQAAWNAVVFGIAYAATLDALHTALPSLHIYAQSPLNPAAGAAANAVGSTLQDYCNAIQAACVGRAWVTYVNGATIITSPGTELTDGVHPNNAGNATYAAFADALLP